MAAADEKQQGKSTVREYYEALLIALIFVNFARIFAFQAFKIPSGSMEDNLKIGDHIIVNFARIFAFQAFKIPSGSMEDNLKIGDHIIVNKFIYGPKGDNFLTRLLPMRDVRRGDIIVFRYPEEPNLDFVKRVIGVPGDTVLIRNKKVYINGRPLDEPYVVFDDPQMYPDKQ